MDLPQRNMLESGLDATVAICTHNGGSRIGEVLRSLALQETGSLRWEVLVVDNGSTDNTAAVCQELARSFPSPLRVVHEAQLGLSFARQRAAEEARGDIICFLDDDNPAEPDYVANAVHFFATNPKAGSIGGKVLPLWETPPTPLAETVSEFALAICDRGDAAFRYEGLTSGPVGAGMCVRRQLLRQIYRNNQLAEAVTGRKGGSLASGEDTALAIRVKQLGFECWYVPAMRIGHMIPGTRMEFDYLLRLHEGIGRGQASVRSLYDWKARNSLLSALIGAKDLFRWALGKWRGPNQDRPGCDPRLAVQVHELKQRQLWGRATQAISRL